MTSFISLFTCPMNYTEYYVFFLSELLLPFRRLIPHPSIHISWSLCRKRSNENTSFSTICYDDRIHVPTLPVCLIWRSVLFCSACFPLFWFIYTNIGLRISSRWIYTNWVITFSPTNVKFWILSLTPSIKLICMEIEGCCSRSWDSPSKTVWLRFNREDLHFAKPLKKVVYAQKRSCWSVGASCLSVCIRRKHIGDFS